MLDFIKFCSDTFYGSLHEFASVFRECVGAGCFLGFILVFLWFLAGFIIIIFETVKKILISWKQRKADKDA
jgi:hypothetical protein